MVIESMRPEDRDAVHALLGESKLPLDGFDDSHVTALVARDAGRVVGSAALELYFPYALLRSVAVATALRGQGLGQRLTTEAIALARRHEIQAIFLLTETAAGFFPKLGFVLIPRTEIPFEVQQSVEFTTACPAGAQALVLRL